MTTEEKKVRTIIIDGVEIQTSLSAIEIADLEIKNKELQKEIEELKQQNQNLIVNATLEVHKNTTKNLNDLELLNEGWKKKIQDKIDEYTNLLMSCNRFSDVDRIKAINERILILKELLQEE